MNITTAQSPHVNLQLGNTLSGKINMVRNEMEGRSKWKTANSSTNPPSFPSLFYLWPEKGSSGLLMCLWAEEWQPKPCESNIIIGKLKW